jgi:hypothetical protein
MSGFKIECLELNLKSLTISCERINFDFPLNQFIGEQIDYFHLAKGMGITYQNKQIDDITKINILDRAIQTYRAQITYKQHQISTPHYFL